MRSIAHPEFFYADHSEKKVVTGSKNLWAKFMDYSEKQQSNRLFWLAIGLGGHGCIFTIATLTAVLLTGNIFALFVIACFAMALVLVVNLAALPTKITIPVLALSLLADIMVIISAILLY